MKKFGLFSIYLFLMTMTLVGCYKPAPEVEPWQLTLIPLPEVPIEVFLSSQPQSFKQQKLELKQV